ncbi:MAG: response regulator [Thermoleophilia bacterium]
MSAQAGLTALVVDDEPLVRNVATIMLEEARLTVLSAENGREAIDLFEQHGDTVGLIVLDMSMPGLSGTETLRELRRRGCQAPVVLSSGMDERDAMPISSDPRVLFIQKPYSMAALHATVDRALALR